ncbi:MAG: PASTA domain-containing protein [Ignavibacteriales bacterium]|nr:PASTA domain-containing protein [Ignavibacteriales bacterium]
MEFTPHHHEPEPDEQNSGTSWRLLVLKAVLALCFLAIVVRLVVIQVIDAPKFRAIARKQYEQKFVLPAVRGNIYDRHGHVLVSNTMFVSFAADPKIVGDGDKAVAESFARVFGKPASHYLSRLRSDPSRRFVWLDRRVSPASSRRLPAGELDGVVLVNEPKRLYHYDELAASLVGFTDIDNHGISGIELFLDEDLRGTPGSVVMQRDGLGRTRPSADYPTVTPVNGHHLSLTIDLSYQAILEEELKTGVAVNKADGGLAVMLDPKTGEILALAIVPSVNPNTPGSYEPGTARNRVITDIFEPGSIFKIVTAAAAYEHDLISPDHRFNAENGLYKVIMRGKVVRLIRDTHEHETLTFQEGLEQSSNIVMAKAVELIGSEQFYRQARDFGFGIPTGVDLPGEVRGRLKKPQEWSGITMQTMAYGYEVAVTPLQIAAAYAAIANGGVLMKPYIVRQVFSESADVVRENRPQRIRRVVSAETASKLTQAFEGAVEHGTAQEVHIRGIRVAGKTGTARRVVDGQYTQGNYTASFVGYFPVEDPQVVCLVMMENPRARGYYGGATSGPIFRAVAERVLQTSSKFQRPPHTGLPEDERTIIVPDVRTITHTVADRILRGQGLTTELYGRGRYVLRQSPEPGSRTTHGAVIKLVLRDEPSADPSGLITVPDIRGLSVRRAVNRLVLDKFDVALEGSGIVVHQTPPAGRKVAPGSTVRLVCKSREITSAALY